MEELTIKKLLNYMHDGDHFYICEKCEKIMWESLQNIYMEDTCPECKDIIAEIQVQN